MYKRQEDKNPAIGQIGICLLSKARKLVQLKKLKLDDLKIVVIDEADFFFNSENELNQTKDLYAKIDKAKEGVQKLFFSATYQPAIVKFIENLVPDNSIKIEIPKEKLTLRGIKQMYHLTKKAEGEDGKFNSKLRVIKQIYEQFDDTQVIVFVNTRAYVNVIYKYLTDEGYTVSKLMGQMEYAERDQVMRDFRNKKITFLIATNLLSRGIDIPGMNCVINFDVPYMKDEQGFLKADFENYIHRIGRTGRFDTKGVALTLIGVEDFDNEMAVLDEIKDHFGSSIEELKEVDQLEDIYNEHTDPK